MKRFFFILLMLAATVRVALAVGYVYDPQGGSVSHRWEVDDMCGVLTTSGTEIIHWVTVGGENDCELSAYGWSLTPATRYCAYYPFSEDYRIKRSPMTALPVSYAGQVQTGNDSMGHLGKYDFMTAQTSSTNAACHFGFGHLGSILRMECTVNGGQPLRCITLSTDDDVLVTSATMDITTGTLTPAVRGKELSLDLDEMTLGEGEKLVAYMMVPQMNLSGVALTVALVSCDGDTVCTQLRGTEILPGHVYPVALEMPPFLTDGEGAPSDGPDAPLAKPMSIDVEPMPQGAKLTAVTIQSPTASAPDFTPDALHRFEQANYILGDINGDGKVLVNDAVMLVNHYLAGTTATLDIRAADVNRDGSITVADAVAIINIFLNNK